MLNEQALKAYLMEIFSILEHKVRRPGHRLGGVRNSVFRASRELHGRSAESLSVKDSELIHGVLPIVG